MNHDETAPVTSDATPEAAPRSLWTNLRDVILEPSATFEDVGRRPRWVWPLVFVIVTTILTSFLLMPMFVELQELGLARREMSAEQREQAENMMAIFKWVGLVMAPITVTVITAIFALIFWAWAAISGAKNASFKVAFASLLYAGVLIVLQSIAQWIVMLVKGPEQIALEGGPPTFGLALFVERGDMSRWLWGLLASVNFFSIWYAVVLAIAGIHALRMAKGSATAFAIAMWLMGALLFALQAPPPA